MKLDVHIPCDMANPSLGKYPREILKYKYQVYSKSQKQTKQKENKITEIVTNRLGTVAHACNTSTLGG